MNSIVLIKDFKMAEGLSWTCDLCGVSVGQGKKVYGNTFKEQYNFMVCDGCGNNKLTLLKMREAIIDLVVNNKKPL